LRINGAAVRAVRDHCFEIVPATAPGKVASAEGTPVELERRLSIRRRQIGRESEIASAGGVPLRRWRSRSGSFPRSSSNLANCAHREV
jgi:hypothetical protein